MLPDASVVKGSHLRPQRGGVATLIHTLLPIVCLQRTLSSLSLTSGGTLTILGVGFAATALGLIRCRLWFVRESKVQRSGPRDCEEVCSERCHEAGREVFRKSIGPFKYAAGTRPGQGSAVFRYNRGCKRDIVSNRSLLQVAERRTFEGMPHPIFVHLSVPSASA